MDSVVDLASRYPIAVGAVVTFAVIQFGFFVDLIRRLHRIRCKFESSHLSLSNVGKESIPEFTAWLINTPDAASGSVGDRPTVDRHAALQEFDRWIGSFFAYGMLHRTAVMAPLLGVIITALSFLQWQAPGESDNMKQILQAVTPLVLGVGAGACLAFMNQLLLQFADLAANSTRSAAEKWLERQLRLAEHRWQREETGPAEVFAETARALGKAASRNQRILSAMESLANRLENIESTFTDAVTSLPREVARLPEQVAALQQAVDATVTNCKRWSAAMEAGTASFEGVTRLLQETFRETFQPLCEDHRETAKALAQSSHGLHDVVKQLRAGCETLQSVTELHMEAASSVNDVVVQRLAPKFDSFEEMVGRMTESVDQLTAPISRLQASLSHISKTGEGLAAAATHIDLSCSRFVEAVESRFVPAAEKHLDAQKRVDTASQKLADAVRTLVASAESHCATMQQFRQSLEEHAVPAHHLLHRATTHLDATTEEMAEQTERFSDCLRSTASVIQQFQNAANSAGRVLSESTAALKNVLERSLTPATDSHRQALQQIGDFNDRMSQAIDGLRETLDQWRELAGSRAAVARDFEQTARRSREALDQLAHCGDAMAALLESRFTPAQDRILAAATSFQQSAADLRVYFDEGVEPLNREMAALAASCAKTAATLESLQALTQLNTQIEQLTQSMSRIPELLDVMERLSDRIYHLTKSAESSQNGESRDRPQGVWKFFRKR